jgi:hypothetical protein
MKDFPPIYFKIKGQEGYKTEKEIIDHLRAKRKAAATATLKKIS